MTTATRAPRPSFRDTACGALIVPVSVTVAVMACLIAVLQGRMLIRPVTQSSQAPAPRLLIQVKNQEE
jgi:hypothetical protein